MNYKIRRVLAAVFILGFTTTFQGCSSNLENTEQEIVESGVEDDLAGNVEKTQTSGATDSGLNAEEMFSERDKEIGYEESTAVHITLKNNLSECSSGLVSISDNVIIIKGEGTFILSGSLSDGQVVVDAEKTDKIQLVFNGVDINCNTDAPLYIRQADKVFVTLEQGTENSLSNQKEFTVVENDTNIDAVVFSKDDLTFNGGGSLTINSADHGIVSKDDLVITGGNFQIKSTGHALNGKESVRIANGKFQLSPVKDGIHSEDKDDDSLGFVYISGGDFEIVNGDDGIHAASYLVIDGGNITITDCYEGIEGQKIEIVSGTISLMTSDDGLNAAGGTDGSGFGENGGDPFASDDNCYIKISGGIININAEGDGVDSNGNLYVSGGETYVSGPTNSGNGAIDYNGEAEITGGIFVAVGAGGMAQNFGSSSTQGCILVNASAGQSGEVILKDSDGNEILSFAPEKTYSSVVISSPEIKEGESYEVVMGSESTTVEMSSLIYGSGGMMGGGHGGMGGHGDGGHRPDRNGVPKNIL